MNRKNQKGVALIIVPVVLVATVLVLAIVLFSQAQNNTADDKAIPLPTPTEASDNLEKLKAFRSSVMEFEIDIPVSYEIKERSSSVSIFAPEGEIRVLRNGTEYDNLDGYVAHLEEFNGVSFQKESDSAINNLSAQKGILEGELTYFIYTNHVVYSVSTSEEALYSDLDQIAKSFRYTPNQK